MGKVVIDPPMGWRFGFPAVYDGDLGDEKAIEAFCIKRGYPQKLIDQGMLKHCRWWDFKPDKEEGDVKEHDEEAGATAALEDGEGTD